MIRRNLGMHAALVAFGVLDPFMPGQLRIMETCAELRRAGIRPKDVQAYAVDKPVAWASVAAAVLDEHTQRCRTIPGYQEAAPTRLRRYKVACRARSLLSFAAAVLWARLKTARYDFMSPSVLRFWRHETGASWAMAEALVLQPARHFESLLKDAETRWVESLLPRPVASLLEVTGRRGPGRQLRDERERVGEPLRVLAAFAGLTSVEVGEIERGLRVPTTDEWASFQICLPELGSMEAPPTEAERSPVARSRAEIADLVLHTRLLHPAGRCTCGSGGTGTCSWCRMDKHRTKMEARERPVLGNRIPRPRVDVAAEIASEAMKTLARAPRPAKEPSDRSAKRPKQAQARAVKRRRKARKGWA